jgi:hypothetical protein
MKFDLEGEIYLWLRNRSHLSKWTLLHNKTLVPSVILLLKKEESEPVPQVLVHGVLFQLGAL